MSNWYKFHGCFRIYIQTLHVESNMFSISKLHGLCLDENNHVYTRSWDIVHFTHKPRIQKYHIACVNHFWNKLICLMLDKWGRIHGNKWAHMCQLKLHLCEWISWHFTCRRYPDWMEPLLGWPRIWPDCWLAGWRRSLLPWWWLPSSHSCPTVYLIGCTMFTCQSQENICQMIFIWRVYS